MMMQIGKYWVSDYLSLFLRGICICKFFSNSLMWSLLVMIPDIFSQDISDFSVSLKRMNELKAYPYSVGKLGKQPIFISTFSRWRGNLVTI